MTISQTLFIESLVIQLGQKAACGETFKMMWHWLTLNEGQSHSVYWKFGNCPFLITFNNISDTIHSKVIPWPKGIMWGDLQSDRKLGDLDLQSREQSLLENEKIYPIYLSFFTLSQTLFIGSRVMKSGQ